MINHHYRQRGGEGIRHSRCSRLTDWLAALDPPFPSPGGLLLLAIPLFLLYSFPALSPTDSTGAGWVWLSSYYENTLLCLTCFFEGTTPQVTEPRSYLNMEFPRPPMELAACTATEMNTALCQTLYNLLKLLKLVSSTSLVLPFPPSSAG